MKIGPQGIFFSHTHQWIRICMPGIYYQIMFRVSICKEGEEREGGKGSLLLVPKIKRPISVPIVR